MPKNKTKKPRGNSYTRLKARDRERLVAFVAQSYYDDADAIASALLKRCTDEEIERWQASMALVKKLAE